MPSSTAVRPATSAQDPLGRSADAHSFLLLGPKGTGKFSMLHDAIERNRADGIAVCEAHEDLEVFRIRFGKALNFEYHEDNYGGASLDRQRRLAVRSLLGQGPTRGRTDPGHRARAEQAREGRHGLPTRAWPTHRRYCEQSSLHPRRRGGSRTSAHAPAARGELVHARSRCPS